MAMEDNFSPLEYEGAGSEAKQDGSLGDVASRKKSSIVFMLVVAAGIVLVGLLSAGAYLLVREHSPIVSLPDPDSPLALCEGTGGTYNWCPPCTKPGLCAPCPEECQCPQGTQLNLDGGGCRAVVPDSTNTSSDQIICESERGSWRRAGLAGEFHCIRPYADGGSACVSSSGCTGRCLKDSEEPAYCEYDDNPFGCFTTIEDYESGVGGLCVD
jgi:hypothetical protein